MSSAPTDGFGNTPWGGDIVALVTPTDGYGPMGWGNEGEPGSTRLEAAEPVGGLVRGHVEHLTRSRDR